MNPEQTPTAPLPCAVIRDLLPLYLEGLTSSQTDRAIEAHLANCPDCAQYRAALSAPLPSPDSEEAAKEPDYLKTIRRRGFRRTAIAVLAAVLTLLAAASVKTFFIGSPAQADDMIWQADRQKEDCLTLTIHSPSSAAVFRGWQIERQGDVVAISARKALASPVFGGSSQAGLDIPLDGVGKVELCGAVVWQNELIIPQETWRAWQARAPYTGDAPALNRLAQALNISLLCGDFTNSLQTDSPPYGWTLHFSQIPQDDAALDRQMERLAYQMLALTGNLEQVRWTYPRIGGGETSRVFTLQQADYRLSVYFGQEKKLKDYGRSPAELERLRQTIAAEDFPINP